MNGMALFAGISGIELGLARAIPGYRTVCYVENEPYCVEVIRARIRDGLLDDAPIWDDVRTFDGRDWCGLVDIVTGGFPCQDVSVAGKGEGIEGSRSGLWTEMARIVCEVRPIYVFVENVPGLLGRGMGRVLGDLVAIGYDAVWTCLQAAEVGAPHRRKRVFILAYSQGKRNRCQQDEQRNTWIQQNSQRWQRMGNESSNSSQDVAYSHNAEAARQREYGGEGLSFSESNVFGKSGHDVAHTDSKGLQDGQGFEAFPKKRQTIDGGSGGWWSFEPEVGRVAHGVPSRVDRLKALGNAVVPQQAEVAFRMLWEMMRKESSS